MATTRLSTGPTTTGSVSPPRRARRALSRPPAPGDRVVHRADHGTVHEAAHHASPRVVHEAAHAVVDDASHRAAHGASHRAAHAVTDRAAHADSPRAATPRRRPLAARSVRGLLLLAVASVVVTSLPAAAVAAPAVAPSTPEQAAALVAQKSRELEVVSEQVNDAQVVLQRQQAAAGTAEQSAAAARSTLDASRAQLRQVARGAYTGDQLSRFGVLMTSTSPADFVAQVNTLDLLAGHTGTVVDQAAAAASVAAQAQAAADMAARTAQQALDRVTAQQADLTGQIADYQARYEQLTAAQQAEVARRVAGQQLAAPQEVTATADGSAGSSDPGNTVAAATDTSSSASAGGSAAVQVALDTAMAQLGDPYVWGAAGPNAFDCSGLTLYAYAAAGISLPHSSNIQSTMGRPVSRSDLQPGDLVFFYSPVSHVGMYIGNGKMVHAPTFGSPVQVTSVDMKGYAGARRFG